MIKPHWTKVWKMWLNTSFDKLHKSWARENPDGDSNHKHSTRTIANFKYPHLARNNRPKQIQQWCEKSQRRAEVTHQMWYGLNSAHSHGTWWWKEYSITHPVDNFIFGRWIWESVQAAAGQCVHHSIVVPDVNHTENNSHTMGINKLLWWRLVASF